jgi:hypothetical protein
MINDFCQGAKRAKANGKISKDNLWRFDLKLQYLLRYISIKIYHIPHFPPRLRESINLLEHLLKISD